MDRKDIKITAVAVLICGIGIGGFVYANQRDAASMEYGMQQVDITTEAGDEQRETHQANASDQTSADNQANAGGQTSAGNQANEGEQPHSYSGNDHTDGEDNGQDNISENSGSTSEENENENNHSYNWDALAGLDILNSLPQGMNADALKDQYIKELWLDEHKIIVLDNKNQDTTISAKEAAKIGLDSIKDDLGQQDDDCNVLMYHMNTYGAGKTIGTWVGVTIMNQLNRHEFRINDETGKLLDRKDYVATGAKDEWNQVTGEEDGEEDGCSIIQSGNLKPFQKIEARDIEVNGFEIVEGYSYGIYIKYNNYFQKANYENKDGVLKINTSMNSEYDNQYMDGTITITVPTGAKLDSVIIHSKSGTVTIPQISIKKLDVALEMGDINLSKTKYESAALDATYGDINFSACDIKESDISVTYGTLCAESCMMQNTTITSEYGEIEVLNAVSNNLSIRCYDDVKVVGDLKGENKITSSMGEVIIGCMKEKSNYSYDLKAPMDDIYIDNKNMKKSTITIENKDLKNSLCVSSDMDNIYLFFGVDPKNDITVEQDNDNDEDWDNDLDNDSENYLPGYGNDYGSYWDGWNSGDWDGWNNGNWNNED